MVKKGDRTDRSNAVLLLWIIYVISVLFCYAFVRVCLLMRCGHLLGKDWPLGSRLLCLNVKLSGQVRRLIVSIPDICPLSYFHPMYHNAHS